MGDTNDLKAVSEANRCFTAALALVLCLARQSDFVAPIRVE